MRRMENEPSFRSVTRPSAVFLRGAGIFLGSLSAVIQKLVQNAVDIKSENDLTV